MIYIEIIRIQNIANIGKIIDFVFFMVRPNTDFTCLCVNIFSNAKRHAKYTNIST